MWKPNWLRKPTGSTISLEERHVLALEEQNALLRAQLELAGARNLPKKVLDPHPRIRTEADITHQTRASILKHQEELRQAQRPWAESSSDAGLADPTKSKSSTTPPTDGSPGTISPPTANAHSGPLSPASLK